MPPRVCILAETTPFAWVAHYVRAFRRCCDVSTVGPAPSPEDLERWELSHLSHLVEPNDVTADLGELQDLSDVLPEGWSPDLIVAIASNGRPAYTATHRLECPSVFISIDTWQCLVDFEHARYYDVVFVAQREFVEPMRAMGARHVYWLPLAADPEVHYPVDGEADHDIAFVGNANAVAHRARAALLEELGAHFSCHRVNRVYGDDYCRAFARGRLAFNKSAMEDLNMRVFEALAMGRCLLTDHQAARNGLLDLFEEGTHLVTYTDNEDLLTQARRYLHDSAERETIAAAGRSAVLARHTYDHRVRTIFDTVAGLQPREGPRASRGLLTHLPRIPGAVVDVGMASRCSKHAVRRLGGAAFIGVAPPNQTKSIPANRYDETFAWPGEVLKADTAIIADPDALPGAIDSVLHAAHTMLNDGGTLLLALPESVLSAEGLPTGNAPLAEWLRARDFHLTHGHRAASGVILAARKRSRRLRDVLAEFSDRFSAADGAFEPGYLDRIPEDV